MVRTGYINILFFKAVKSNNDPIFLSLLANIGMGFDCASKREIELVLGLNVAPDNIIFAHPCKQLSHIRFVFRLLAGEMYTTCVLGMFVIKV